MSTYSLIQFCPAILQNMIYLFSLNLLLTVGLWRPFRPVFNNTKDSSSENLEITLVPFNVGPLF